MSSGSFDLNLIIKIGVFMTVNTVHNIEPLIALGWKGVLDKDGVNNLSAYTKKLSHHITSPYGAKVYSITTSAEGLTAKVAELYKNLVTDNTFIPGPFGDCLTILPVGTAIDRSQELQYMVSIARKTFRTPACAADAVHILKGINSKGKTIFQQVGIIRKAEPGKDKGATIGGFNNVNISAEGIETLASPISTAFEESDEEAGAKLTMTAADKRRVADDYNCERIDAKIKLKDELYSVVVMNAGVFKTSDELLSNGGERISLLDSAKRVHQATSILVFVDCNKRNIEDALELKEWYKADSDAAGICINDVTNEVNGSTSLEIGLVKGAEFVKKNGWGIIHHGSILGAAWYKANQHLNLF